MRLRQFLRDWSLPIAMSSGVVMYLLYVNIPLVDSVRRLVAEVISYVQPALIFAMLFVTFCKVRVAELKPKRWHPALLAFQLTAFIAISLSIYVFKNMPLTLRVLLEAAMLCLICPTATAAAVITARLGGNSASLVSYTMQINIAVAMVTPLFLALSHPVEGESITSSFLLIMSKVFPLLLLPLLCSELLRRAAPGVHGWLISKGRNLPFYLWLVALSLAIAVTCRAIAHSAVSIYVMAGIAAVSLACCLMQFAIGRHVGRRHGELITGGQALGQKNTVFGIWFAYTFLTPVTAIACGFYSIWHNLVNTWQLYKRNNK